MTTAKSLLEQFDKKVENAEWFWDKEGQDTDVQHASEVRSFLLSALRQAQDEVRPTSLPTHNMIYKKQGYTWNEFDLLQKKFWEGVE